MARRKSDDIFKKLNKQTPLVKRADIKPLSQRDFAQKKSALDLEIEKKAQQRRTATPKRAATEKSAISQNRSRSAYRRQSDKKGASLAGSYNATKRQPQPSAKRELDIFTDSAKNSAAADTRIKPPANTAKAPQRPAPPARRTEAARQPVRPKTAPSSRANVMYEADTATQKEMKFRHELKFYINYRDYILTRNAMRALLSPDAYTGDDNTYHIRSLYFDDVYESAVKEKMAGIDNRSKYRIRIYNYSDDVIRFEKKIKQGQFVAKKSFLLSRDEYDMIIAGEYDFLRDRKEALATELYFELRTNMLRPRVLVDYTREAYVSPIENVRITFDKDLKAGLMLTDIFNPKTPVMPMFDKGIMVLEVKFNRFLPEVIRGIVNGMNATNRSAISKYIICRKYD